MNVGILALQGDVIEHIKMIKRLDANPVEVRIPEDLQSADALIMPGGESTAIGKLMQRVGLDTAIIRRANEGMPIYGTCAGMILLAKKKGLLSSVRSTIDELILAGMYLDKGVVDQILRLAGEMS